ncbi:MAG TPA: MFS transporter [Vicinamibacteria bacterium]|nr:MFS transporter [Vicinamibacteria bacterium]
MAQTCAQLGAFAFPAILPELFEEWHITHADAGWLSGIFFAGYALSVPFLVSLTDRVPARHVYALAVALTAFSHLGMAFLASGFWSALGLRVAAGTGWAGTYMVGLKALTDEVSVELRSRAVALHAASLGVSGALSFALAGQMATWAGWRFAFVVGAVGSFSALAISTFLFPRRRSEPTDTRLLDFRPVLRNRASMAYSIAYCAHTWEMFAVRSWAVTFLAFAAARGGNIATWMAPTFVATGMELLGTVTSVLGNEVALRMGRRRFVLTVMLLSTLVSLVAGLSSVWGYGFAAVTFLAYNAVIYADSASLTAGAIEGAPPGRRGATLAVHATLGYGGGFIGPLALGIILDAAGGNGVTGWGLGFAHIAIVMVLGSISLWRGGGKS